MKKALARGTIYLMSAQLIFLISSYAVHFGLGRYLGPELYGTFGIILSLLTICRVFVEPGTVRAISKYTAERKELAVAIKNQAIKIQIILALKLVAKLDYRQGINIEILNRGLVTPVYFA